MLAPRGRLRRKLPTPAQPTQAKRQEGYAAQPGNRRRRFATQRAQASSPAKRQALVTFATRLAAKRKGEHCAARRAGVLACETLGVGNFFGGMALKFVPPTHPTQARRLRSLLCRAPKGDGQASAAGATAEIITTAYTTDARRDARKGERCAARQPPKALCNAKSAGVLACETLGGGNLCDTLGSQEEG